MQHMTVTRVTQVYELYRVRISPRFSSVSCSPSYYSFALSLYYAETYTPLVVILVLNRCKLNSFSADASTYIRREVYFFTCYYLLDFFLFLFYIPFGPMMLCFEKFRLFILVICCTQLGILKLGIFNCLTNL